jgi:hypothetical protein
LKLAINIIAIIVTAAIYFGIHMLWYFPFAFGKRWLEEVGKESEPRSKILRDTYIMIPTSFITILILAIVIESVGAPFSGLLGTLYLCFLLWAGFVATIGINQSNFNDRTSVVLFVIEYGFYLIGFIVSGIILSLWQ